MITAQIPILIEPKKLEKYSTETVEIPAETSQKRTEHTATAYTRYVSENILSRNLGSTLQDPRKSTFNNIPIGTIDIAAANDTKSALTPIQIPILAGTIVVGKVIIPPIAPPLLSMKTVARIATIAAINDDKII